MTGEVFAFSASHTRPLHTSSTTIARWSLNRPETLHSRLTSQPPLPEKHWHRGTITYSPFISKPARLACFSPLHPLENAKNLLPMTHAPFSSDDPRKQISFSKWFGIGSAMVAVDWNSHSLRLDSRPPGRSRLVEASERIILCRIRS